MLRFSWGIRCLGWKDPAQYFVSELPSRISARLLNWNSDTDPGGLGDCVFPLCPWLPNGDLRACCLEMHKLQVHALMGGENGRKTAA